MIFIAGPCAAESREQVVGTAQMLSGGKIDFFRASLWKPRTRAGGFEGVGEVGLEWLSEVKARFGMRVITEIDRPANVELLSKYGIDACWIGARTSCSPFAVADLANEFKGRGIEVFVKNPIAADVALWMGAVERFQTQGVAVSAIHRGFVHWGSTSGLRNEPLWEVVELFKKELPNIKIICDPSHIAGRADLVTGVAKDALKRGADGLMVECHIDPKSALSDASQQLLPNEALELIK